MKKTSEEIKIEIGFGFTPIQFIKYKLSKNYRKKVDDWVNNNLK